METRWTLRMYETLQRSFSDHAPPCAVSLAAAVGWKPRTRAPETDVMREPEQIDAMMEMLKNVR